VIVYTPRAASQVDDLKDYYDQKGRAEAILNLERALTEAETAIQDNPTVGLQAPRPYPSMARQGWLWRKSGHYWVGWRQHPALVIAAVIYDQADMPNRI